MAVECFDMPNIRYEELSTDIPRLTESIDHLEFAVEKNESSTKEAILTISEARNRLKDRFVGYHKLLDDKETELLAELESLEETNKPELDHVRNDLVRLRGVVDSLDESLGTNTLRVFLDEQKSVWETQILSFNRSVELLSRVTLNFTDIENSIRNTIKVIPFWSKSKFRTELQSVLELEPQLEEDWYVVSNKWFSEFTNSINLSNPQQNDSWEFPLNIPIQTEEQNQFGLGMAHGSSQDQFKSDNTRLLHSKAWDMLLAFNDLSPGSIPIKRQSYLNKTTNKIEVPIHTTKHKCTIGHNYGNNRFNFEFEIGTFPNETSEDILNKLSGFSTLFTDYPPIIYTFANTNTIKCDNMNYTVTKPPVQILKQKRYSHKEQPEYLGLKIQPKIIQDAKPFVSVKDKIFLVTIPDSNGNNPFQVASQ